MIVLRKSGRAELVEKKQLIKQMLKILILSSIMIISSIAYAQIQVGPCNEIPLQKLISTKNEATLNLALTLVSPQVYFCLSQEELDSNFDMSLAFNKIKVGNHSAVKQNCINLRKLNGFDKEMRILFKAASSEGDDFSFVFSSNDPSQLYLSSHNPKDKKNGYEVRESAFTSEMIINPVFGVLLVGEAYKGEKDKKAHGLYGAGISVGTSLVGSLILDKTDYTPKTKKMISKAIGPLAGLIVGVLKEILYDAQRKNRHTVDSHDALATAMGAGIVPIIVKFEF